MPGSRSEKCRLLSGALLFLLGFFLGMPVTILVAPACYVAALSVFAPMRDMAPALEGLSAAYPTTSPAPAPESAEASGVLDGEMR